MINIHRNQYLTIDLIVYQAFIDNLHNFYIQLTWNTPFEMHPFKWGRIKSIENATTFFLWNIEKSG